MTDLSVPLVAQVEDCERSLARIDGHIVAGRRPLGAHPINQGGHLRIAELLIKSGHNCCVLFALICIHFAVPL